MHSTNIHLPELSSRSPLLRFLYDGLGKVLTVPGACLFWAVAQAGLFAALCWQQDTLFPEDVRGRMSLLQDTTALSYFFLLPLCFLLLYYSLRLFRRYLNRLPGVLEPSCPPAVPQELADLARHAFSPQGKRKCRLLFTAVGLAIVLLNTATILFPELFRKDPQNWDGTGHPLSCALARLYVLFVWGYAIPLWASAVYMQLHVMVKINRRMAQHGWLRISPYALDRFGGLGRLAVSASWVGYLILAAGLFFLAPLLRSPLWGLPVHVFDYVGLGIYAACASIGFSVPILLLHRILAGKQREMLESLTGAFDQINARVKNLVKEENVQGLAEENLGRALESVDRLYQQWAALPVWPRGPMFVVKMLAMVVSPVAVFVVHQLRQQWSL
jgi:hypothetical protein